MVQRSVCYAILASILFASPVLPREKLPIKATHFFPVKFLCGGSSETFQEGVVRGMHATSISIHNPSNVRAVSFTKRVSRALPFQRSGAASERIVDTLQPQASIDVECNEIRMMLPESMAKQFRSGFLRIQATGELSVVAVYSSRPHEADVTTIDVEVIEPKRLMRGDSGPLPDLIVSEIDLFTLRTDCPSSSSCRATVDVTAKNIGSITSAPATVRVTFDPQQTAKFEHEIPAGLEAGGKTTFKASVATGGSCFDPNCQICAVADAKDVIEESDEGNNQLCREKQG